MSVNLELVSALQGIGRPALAVRDPSIERFSPLLSHAMGVDRRKDASIALRQYTPGQSIEISFDRMKHILGMPKWKNMGGYRYLGAMVGGKPHGHGIIVVSDGAYYQGEWFTGQKQGRGTYIFANGDRYEGEWFADQKQGRGTYVFASGNRYEGEWVADKEQGRGMYVFANGDRYEGEWFKGQKQGRGTYVFANGARYEGEWFADQKQGQGTYVFANGERYEGEWVAGQKQGLGTCVFASGNRYEGEWFADERQGRGTCVFANGDRYEGEWFAGQQQGRGTYVFAEGDRYDGNWENSCIVMTPEVASIELGNSRLIQGFLALQSNIKRTPLAILSEYFNSPILKKAYELARLSIQDAAREILRMVQEEKDEVLYSYVSRNVSSCICHVVGLGIQKEKDTVRIRIFNSGFGLETYHSRSDKHFQTQWVVQIPSKEFSEEFLLELLNNQEKQPIDQLYQRLLAVPKASQINVKAPVWQKPQAGSNCSIEWIFAYLKNSMPELDYHKLRLKLFQDCREKVRAWPKPDAIIIGALTRKITNREEKIALITGGGLSAR